MQMFYILHAGHNRLLQHGKGRSWSRNNAERLAHKLVLEGYIVEEHVNNMDNIVNAYARPGHRILDQNQKVLKGVLMAFFIRMESNALGEV